MELGSSSVRTHAECKMVPPDEKAPCGPGWLRSANKRICTLYMSLVASFPVHQHVPGGLTSYCSESEHLRHAVAILRTPRPPLNKEQVRCGAVERREVGTRSRRKCATFWDSLWRRMCRCFVCLLCSVQGGSRKLADEAFEEPVQLGEVRLRGDNRDGAVVTFEAGIFSWLACHTR